MSQNGEHVDPPEANASPVPVEVKGSYEVESRRALVELRLGHAVVQMESQKARELSRQLAQAAAAIEADAFMFDFAQAELGVDDLAAALLLRQFRAWRLAHESNTRDDAPTHDAPPPGANGPVADHIASFLASKT